MLSYSELEYLEKKVKWGFNSPTCDTHWFMAVYKTALPKGDPENSVLVFIVLMEPIHKNDLDW